MIKDKITKKQPLITYGLFFFLSILCVLKIISGIFGFFVMLGQFFIMAFYFERFIKRFDEKNSKLFSRIFLFAYCIVSLSICYYLFGLSALTLLAWLTITSCLAVIIGHKSAEAEIDFTFIRKTKKSFLEIIDSFSLIATTAGISYLIAHLFANPIKNGSPTPWINISSLTFIIFFIITFLFLKNFIDKRTNILTAIFYFFLI